MPRLPTFLAVLLALAGCAPDAPNSQVEQDWTKSVSRFSLNGIYPPTEDLQPGDVLLDVPVAPGPDVDLQPRAVRLGSLKPKLLLDALTEQAGKRLVIDSSPPSSADKPSGAATTPPAKPTPGSTRDPSASRRAIVGTPPVQEATHILSADTPQPGPGTARLHRIALPGMTVARIYNWQIGGTGPIGRVAIALGLSSAGSTALLMHLDQLESLALDATTEQILLRKQIFPWLQDNHLTPTMLLTLAARANPGVARRICLGEAPGPATERAVVRVVNRVVYAHDIDYEYTRDSQFAGRLAADVAQTAAAKAAAPAVGSAQSTAPAAAGAENLAARVAALETALASSQPSTAGVRTTVGVGTYGNAMLKQTYARPIAVGFEAAQTFTLRSALVTTAGAARVEDADQELKDVRKFCALAFQAADPPDTTQPGQAPELAKVEIQICNNMRMRPVAPWLDDLAQPSRCLAQGSRLPVPVETGFTRAGTQEGASRRAYTIP